MVYELRQMIAICNTHQGSTQYQLETVEPVPDAILMTSETVVLIAISHQAVFITLVNKVTFSTSDSTLERVVGCELKNLLNAELQETIKTICAAH